MTSEVCSHRSILRFPCDFPIKIIGQRTEAFEHSVVATVRRHAPDLGEGAVRETVSRNGNFLSLTVTVRARSREQLDRLYEELTGSDLVIVVL